jgi:hypothetical protein
MQIEQRDTRTAITLTATLPDSARRVTVEIMKPYDRFGGYMCEPQVNWSALGSVSIEDALAYGALITYAAGVASSQATPEFPDIAE